MALNLKIVCFEGVSPDVLVIPWCPLVLDDEIAPDKPYVQLALTETSSCVSIIDIHSKYKSLLNLMGLLVVGNVHKQTSKEIPSTFPIFIIPKEKLGLIKETVRSHTNMQPLSVSIVPQLSTEKSAGI